MITFIIPLSGMMEVDWSTDTPRCVDNNSDIDGDRIEALCGMLFLLASFRCSPLFASFVPAAASTSSSFFTTSCTSSSSVVTNMVEKKELWILRHGQATHNPRAEAAREAGCSWDEFLELMRQDDSLDAELTPLGREQALGVRTKYLYNNNENSNDSKSPACSSSTAAPYAASSSTFSNSSSPLASLDLIISSPLSRALQTADLAVPSWVTTNRFVHEDFREINGLLLNAQRRSRTELERLFPSWNLEHLASDHDPSWTAHELEARESCGERGYQGLQWLMQRPEQRILLVAHGGLLRFVMSEHVHVQVKDERRKQEKTQSEQQQHQRDFSTSSSSSSGVRPPNARFSNCELRRYRIEWDSTTTISVGDGDDGAAAPEGDRSTGVDTITHENGTTKLDDARPDGPRRTIILTELDIE